MPKFTHRKKHGPVKAESDAERMRTVPWPTAIETEQYKPDEPDPEDMKMHNDLTLQDVPPTAAEFQLLERASDGISLTYRGGGKGKARSGGSYKYAERDNVIIIPTLNDEVKKKSVKDSNLWKGTIVDIRVANTRYRDQFWVKVAWYYSPKDFSLLNVSKFGDGDWCGDYELVYSPNHTDILEGETLNETLTIQSFEESDYDQLPIKDKTYYFRCVYDDDARTWTTAPPDATCICEMKYKGDADSAMRFCAREGCNKWYHVNCLERRQYFKIDKAWDVKIKYEKNFGDRHRMRLEGDVHRPKPDDRQDATHANAAYVAVTKNFQITNLARQPIMRGGEYSLVGNIGPVLRARYLLDLAFKNNEWIGDWAEAFVCCDRTWANNSASIAREMKYELPRPEGATGVKTYKCPYCDGYI